MHIERKCKICGEKFIAIKTTQFFCQRKCFKKDFYQRTKSSIQDEKRSNNYPTKRCNYCEKSSKLSFDPLKNMDLFNAWGCPHCGATNRLVWEYRDEPRSHQIIESILAGMQQNIIQSTAPQYHTYFLPVARLEQGNGSIVVMTCEMLDILDIRKGTRKRIIFS